MSSDPCARCGKAWINGTCDDTPSRRGLCARKAAEREIESLLSAVENWKAMALLYQEKYESLLADATRRRGALSAEEFKARVAEAKRSQAEQEAYRKSMEG